MFTNVTIYNHKKYEQLKERMKKVGFSPVYFSEMYIKKHEMEDIRRWLLLL